MIRIRKVIELIRKRQMILRMMVIHQKRKDGIAKETLPEETSAQEGGEKTRNLSCLTNLAQKRTGTRRR